MKSYAYTKPGSCLARVETVLASPAWTDANEREVFRQLGLGNRNVVAHSAGLSEGSVSGPCAKCLDAVSELGARPDTIPSLAATYELLFENTKAPDVEKFFPTTNVWTASGPDERQATGAIDVLANQFGTKKGHSATADYMREEMTTLLDMLSRSRYQDTETPLVGLGRVQNVRIGDLVRIAVFVAVARVSGVESTRLDEVRELAVEAIRA